MILATLMQALDTTIANVALPYMQGSVSASQDQINWVLTSYIVAAAIMTPPTGFLAGRFGRKRLFLVSVAGFTVASMLCGMAQSLAQIVLFRILQGAVRRGARAAVAVRAARHLSAGAPGLRDGAVGRARDGRPDPRPDARRLADRELQLALGLLHQPADRHRSPSSASPAFLPETERNAGAKLDWFGFGTLEPRDRRAAGHARPRRAARLVRLRRDLDRGDRRRLGLLPVPRPHLHGATSRSCGRRCSATATSRPARSSSSIVGLTYLASLALQPPYLQNLMNYPVVTAGLVMGPRGIGTMAAMMIVGRLIGRVDTRLLLAVGLGLTAWSFYDDDRLDAGRLAGDDHRHRGGPGRRPRLSVRAAEHGDLGDAAAASTAPKAPVSTICRAISAPASASRW